MQKLLGHNAALWGRSLQLGLRKGMALNRHTRGRSCGSRFRRNAAELFRCPKFAMVNLGVKLKFHFVWKFFGHEESITNFIAWRA